MLAHMYPPTTTSMLTLRLKSANMVLGQKKLSCFISGTWSTEVYLTQLVTEPFPKETLALQLMNPLSTLSKKHNYTDTSEISLCVYTCTY